VSSTFTGPTLAAYPLLVTQWNASSSTRHIVHEILGNPIPDVTLQPAGPRTGTMSALFDNEADASALHTSLRGTDVLTFSDDDTATPGMTFIANGTVTITTDSQNQACWTVAFDYLEVQP
jgi:hypothetical protein